MTPNRHGGPGATPEPTVEGATRNDSATLEQLRTRIEEAEQAILQLDQRARRHGLSRQRPLFSGGSGRRAGATIDYVIQADRRSGSRCEVQ
jgi:hypothetical protein